MRRKRCRRWADEEGQVGSTHPAHPAQGSLPERTLREPSLIMRGVGFRKLGHLDECNLKRGLKKEV